MASTHERMFAISRAVNLSVLIALASGSVACTTTGGQPTQLPSADGLDKFASLYFTLGAVEQGTDEEQQYARDGVLAANVVLHSACFRTELDSRFKKITEANGDTSADQVIKKLAHKANFNIAFYTGSRYANYIAKTIGVDREDDPHTVHMNRHFVRSGWWVASNLLHEAAHAYGYHHYGVKTTSVPYTLNDVFAACLDKAYAEARSVDQTSPKTKRAIPAKPANADVRLVEEEPNNPPPTVTIKTSDSAKNIDRLCGLAEALSAVDDAPTMTPPARILGVDIVGIEGLKTDFLTETKLSADGLRQALQAGSAQNRLRVNSLKSDPLTSDPLADRAPNSAALVWFRRARSVCVSVKAPLQSANDKLLLPNKTTLNSFATYPTSLVDRASVELSTNAIAAPPPAQDPNATEPFQGNLGNLESTILNGLAEFVVTRAKAEAVDYLTKELSKVLCVKPALDYLASTCAAIAKLDSKLSLQAAGAFLQAAVTRDLRGFPELLLGRLNAASRTSAQDAALFALMMFREVEGGRPPLEFAWSVTTKACHSPNSTKKSIPSWMGSLDEPLCAAGRVLQLIERYRPTNESAEFVADETVKLFASEYALNPQDERDTNALIAKVPTTTVRALADEIRRLSSVVKGIESDTQALAAGSERLSARRRLEIATRAMEALINAALAVGPTVSAIAPVADGVREDILRGLESARGAVGFVSTLYENDTAGVAVNGLALIQRLKLGEQVPPAIEKNLPLLAELGQAKTSKDVADVLAVAAAPVRAYESKYDHPAVAINALLGASGGIEWSGATRPAGAAGLFAPVGLHVTGPVTSQAHVGLFVSVIDVGALTQVRFTEVQSVQQTPNVGVAQVFSPGLFATLGLGRAPFILGFGGQATPGLRNGLQADGSTTKELPSLRIVGLIAMDAPILLF